MSASIGDRRLHLAQLQSLPLGAKIEASCRRIREWYQLHDGDVSVSYSGGKDSTVLSWLVDYALRGNSIPRVFADTGLEYPEVRSFALSEPRVVVVRPKLDFLSVVKRYGYPVVSKETAQKIREAREGSERLRRIRLGQERPRSGIPEKWRFLVDAPFKISEKCCRAMKKSILPANSYVGVMAADSIARFQSIVYNGCNSVSVGASRPMAFWLESDVWAFIKATGIPYSSIYDMGYARTGCCFCMFGLGLEKRPHRFDLMKTTHPQLFSYCMDGPLGLRRVIEIVYGKEMVP